MSSNPTASLEWLDHITLRPEQGLKTQASIVKTLRDQLIAALVGQNRTPADLMRCVYVIRMKGDFVIAYPWARSPVLYIGRGSAFGRISAHLRNWLHQIEGFGKNVSIEIRVCRTRRRNRADMFKHLEADMIAQFAGRYGTIPFFNSRRETSFEGCVSYTDTDREIIRAALGVGKGKRPRWAIAPAPANENYEVFHRGHVDD